VWEAWHSGEAVNCSVGILRGMSVKGLERKENKEAGCDALAPVEN
jgi:hypothetical protein